MGLKGVRLWARCGLVGSHCRWFWRLLEGCDIWTVYARLKETGSTLPAAIRLAVRAGISGWTEGLQPGLKAPCLPDNVKAGCRTSGLGVAGGLTGKRLEDKTISGTLAGYWVFKDKVLLQFCLCSGGVCSSRLAVGVAVGVSV